MASRLRMLRSLVIGLLLFVGLPLLGWGIADVAGFIANPARFGYLILVTLLQVFVVFRYPTLGQHRTEGKEVVARQRLVLPILQVLSLVIALGAPFSDHHQSGVLPDYTVLRFIGVALYAAGFMLMVWAEVILGRQFSFQVTVQEDHHLVTTGPYRYLRHPRYLGIIVVNTGYVLIFRSWLAAVAVAMVVVTLLWRIHDEEHFLHEQFAAEWDTYCATRWRLIPFVF